LDVEDEEMICRLSQEILEGYAYTVLAASDPGQAIEVCVRHGGPIQLLLTDVVLPKLSGTDLAQRVTSLRQDVKVLYMSSYIDDMTVHQGLLEPGVAFLLKPFAPAARPARCARYWTRERCSLERL